MGIQTSVTEKKIEHPCKVFMYRDISRHVSLHVNKMQKQEVFSTVSWTMAYLPSAKIAMLAATDLSVYDYCPYICAVSKHH